VGFGHWLCAIGSCSLRLLFLDWSPERFQAPRSRAVTMLRDLTVRERTPPVGPLQYSRSGYRRQAVRRRQCLLKGCGNGLSPAVPKPAIAAKPVGKRHGAGGCGVPASSTGTARTAVSVGVSKVGGIGSVAARHASCSPSRPARASAQAEFSPGGAAIGRVAMSASRCRRVLPVSISVRAPAVRRYDAFGSARHAGGNAGCGPPWLIPSGVPSRQRPYCQAVFLLAK
jgi:hypothetical protein